MFTKTDFFASLRDEAKILKHLASKIRPEDLDYRPSENQRTTLELLQYLGFCGIVPLEGLLDGWENLGPIGERMGSLTLDGFPAQLDAQIAGMEERLAPMDEAEIRERKVGFPWGGEATLAAALVDLPLKFFTAYRMQLFLYLKACGHTELNTMDCWIGEGRG